MTIYEKIKNMSLEEMIENNVICKFIPGEICRETDLDDDPNECISACEKCQREFAKMDIF